MSGEVWSRDLESAITAAAGFIGGQRSPDGLWRDFQTLAGPSSEWVSGFVAYALGRSGRTDTGALAVSKALLFRQRPNGGWGYNESVPTDCDSTAWVLLSLSVAPVWKPSAVSRAVRYIKAHQDRSRGGCSTYAPGDQIDRFIGAPDPDLTQGWLAPHVCVTAVAMQCLLAHGERAGSDFVGACTHYLLQQRDVSGLWRTYWWPGHAYSTYHCLRALALAGALDPADARATVRALLARQSTDGGWSNTGGEENGAFATAFSLLTLLLVPDELALDGAGRAAAWLVAHQAAHGGWPTVPILRIPPPMVTRPEQVDVWRANVGGTGVIVEDQEGIFTAAAAIWALGVFRAMVPYLGRQAGPSHRDRDGRRLTRRSRG